MFSNACEITDKHCPPFLGTPMTWNHLELRNCYLTCTVVCSKLSPSFEMELYSLASQCGLMKLYVVFFAVVVIVVNAKHVCFFF